jgi:GNAT superfamily N-acetyltransferase
MTTVIEGAATLPATASTDPAAPGRPRRDARAEPPGAGSRWRVVPVGPGDGPALAALFADCSPQTVRLRFFGAPRTLPPEYAAALLAGRPDVHDAVLAYPEGPDPAGQERPEDGGGPRAGRTGLLPQPAGLASLAAAPDSRSGPGGRSGPLTAELGVLVGDAWQRQGAGTAMTAVLLDRARARGVERVAASVLSGRAPLLRAMAARLGLGPALTYDRTGESLSAVYRLRPTARTPGTRGEVPDDDT